MNIKNVLNIQLIMNFITYTTEDEVFQSDIFESIKEILYQLDEVVIQQKENLFIQVLLNLLIYKAVYSILILIHRMSCLIFTYDNR